MARPIIKKADRVKAVREFDKLMAEIGAIVRLDIRSSLPDSESSAEYVIETPFGSARASLSASKNSWFLYFRFDDSARAWAAIAPHDVQDALAQLSGKWNVHEGSEVTLEGFMAYIKRARFNFAPYITGTA